jgi:very-short-patch-repair endonuclease
MKNDMKSTEYYKSGKHLKNILTAREKAAEVSKLNKESRIAAYDLNPSKCAQCGESLNYSIRHNKFCSRSCAAYFNNAVRPAGSESRVKQSTAVSDTASKKSSQYCKIGYCKVCGKVVRGKKILCDTSDCLFLNRSVAGKKGYITAVSRNKFKGWSTRNKEPSYPEKYFIQLFAEEGIDGYEREAKEDKYFIDFAFHQLKIALEIDGKQHNLPDRKQKDSEKDSLLASKGWQVYRIKWFNPRTSAGKDKLYPQIKEFLKIIRV